MLLIEPHRRRRDTATGSDIADRERFDGPGLWAEQCHTFTLLTCPLGFNICLTGGVNGMTNRTRMCFPQFSRGHFRALWELESFGVDEWSAASVSGYTAAVTVASRKPS